MSRKFLTSIDLNSNELQDAVIWKLAAAPTPVEGLIYYNTGDERYYLRQSAAWHDVTGRLDSITSTTNSITIGAFSAGNMSIDIGNANGSQAGLMPATMYNDLLNATSAATASTIVERDASGDAAFNVLTTNDITITNAPSAATDGVNKQYVDNLLASGITIKGGIDASTNPNYPAAIVGDAYYITVDGKIGGAAGEVVETGDMIIAITDNAGGDEAAVGADWIVLQDNIGAASETIAGYIRIATQAETNTGTDDTTAITPLKLATYVASQISGGKFSVDVGNGVATAIAVLHSLGTADVNVTVKDTSTLEQVEADVVMTDANTVTITFAVAPTAAAYRVTVAG